MSKVRTLLMAPLLLTACGAEGSLGAPLGFSTPAAGEVVSDELYLSLAEIGEFPDGVTFFVGGLPLDTDVLPPFETWVDTTEFPDGPLHVAAFPAGKPGAAPVDEREVIVDNHGPNIAFESPIAGDCILAGGALSVRASIEDDVGVESAEFRLDGEPMAVFAGAPYATEVLAEASTTEHRLTIAAQNARGRITNATLIVPSCTPTL